jgi:hypothetical protein
MEKEVPVRFSKPVGPSDVKPRQMEKDARVPYGKPVAASNVRAEQAQREGENPATYGNPFRATGRSVKPTFTTTGSKGSERDRFPTKQAPSRPGKGNDASACFGD